MAPRNRPTIVTEPRAFQDALIAARAQGRRIGFVPTMGALHEGHFALVDEARRRVGEGLVAVSIFVNPTQFGPNEDYSRYPRQLDTDVDALAGRGTDLVFAPEAPSMYPPGEQTRVRPGALAEPLCGRFRPGHFEGVATVVAKLLALAGPCVAVFGRKDYQQLQIIRRMARDLFFPVEVVGLRTLREPDGLAMSSRNRYLASADRERARAIPRGLAAAGRAWERGERNAEALRTLVEQSVKPSVDSIDYVDARDPDSLALPSPAASRLLLALAVRVGGARLIDNVVLGEDPVVPVT